MTRAWSMQFRRFYVKSENGTSSFDELLFLERKNSLRKAKNIRAVYGYGAITMNSVSKLFSRSRSGDFEAENIINHEVIMFGFNGKNEYNCNSLIKSYKTTYF